MTVATDAMHAAIKRHREACSIHAEALGIALMAAREATHQLRTAAVLLKDDPVLFEMVKRAGYAAKAVEMRLAD